MNLNNVLVHIAASICVWHHPSPSPKPKKTKLTENDAQAGPIIRKKEERRWQRGGRKSGGDNALQLERRWQQSSKRGGSSPRQERRQQCRSSVTHEVDLHLTAEWLKSSSRTGAGFQAMDAC